MKTVFDGYKAYITAAAQIGCGFLFFFNEEKELGIALIFTGLGVASLRHGMPKK